MRSGDRTANLRHAITCFEQALRVLSEANHPQLWAEAQNNLGSSLADLPVTPPASGDGGTIDFPLANLPAGEFLIEIAAKSADGADATELIAFRMVG